MDGTPLEPVPATVDALDLLGPLAEQVQSYLDVLAARIRADVPSVVGLSLALVGSDGLMTFTLAISDERLRALDAVQYLADGPCVDAVAEDRLITTSARDPLDEERWSWFGRASARFGVQSSLSVPIHMDRQTIGGLNIYASGADAFTDQVEGIAILVDATADEAIKDADLAFTGLERAADTLAQIQDQATIDVAAGLLAQREGISEDEATARLVTSASRAGIPAVELAMLVIETVAKELG